MESGAGGETLIEERPHERVRMAGTDMVGAGLACAVPTRWQNTPPLRRCSMDLTQTSAAASPRTGYYYDRTKNSPSWRDDTWAFTLTEPHMWTNLIPIGTGDGALAAPLPAHTTGALHTYSGMFGGEPHRNQVDKHPSSPEWMFINLIADEVIRGITRRWINCAKRKLHSLQLARLALKRDSSTGCELREIAS